MNILCTHDIAQSTKGKSNVGKQEYMLHDYLPSKLITRDLENHMTKHILRKHTKC